jgi:hypothetical protein
LAAAANVYGRWLPTIWSFGPATESSMWVVDLAALLLLSPSE